MPNIHAPEFQATVSRIKKLTHDVRELDLSLVTPASIEFKAGQWISIEVWHPRLKQTVQRQYSIASPPSRSGQITLLFNQVPDGPGSSYLFGLRESDTLKFHGPNGSFYLEEQPSRDLVFVATGTGIAPFRSMLNTLLEQPKRDRLPCIGAYEVSGICTTNVNWRPWPRRIRILAL